MVGDNHFSSHASLVNLKSNDHFWMDKEEMPDSCEQQKIDVIG